MSSEIANVFGFTGMLCVVFAYGYLTAKEQPNPFIVHGGNLIGASLLAVSLMVNTNLPSLVLEGIWACIAVVGLYRAVIERRSAT